MSSINKCAVLSAVLAVAIGGCELTKKKKSSGNEKSAPTGSGSATATAPSGAQPKIVFAKLEHDLGTISDAEPVSHAYKFKNAGTATLVIEKVGST